MHHVPGLVYFPLFQESLPAGERERYMFIVSRENEVRVQYDLLTETMRMKRGDPSRRSSARTFCFCSLYC